jgi:large subunit ribosomal protein L21
MAKYAVININGRQYKVAEGEEILVDGVVDPKLSVETLLLVDGEKVSIGKPIVKGADIKLKKLAEAERGKKVKILKYKAKSRYRRRMGFRPLATRYLVEKIS